MIHDLEIKNFGKISEANVKLAPFTVIVGPNSSGKSFITKALYSIFHTLNQDLFIDAFSEQVTQIKSHIRSYLRPSTPELKKNMSPMELMPLSERLDECRDKLTKISSSSFDFIVSELSAIAEQEMFPILDECTRKLQEALSETKSETKRLPKYHFINFGLYNKEYLEKEYLEKILELCFNLKKFVKEYIENPTKVYSGLLEDNFKQEFLENFQIKSLSNLTNLGSQEESLFKVSRFGELKFKNERIQFALDKNGIRQFRELRNVIYLESPIYFKAREALLKLKDDTQNHWQRMGYLSGIPKYFYDVDQLLTSNFREKDEDRELKEVVKKIEENIGGSFEMSHSILSFNDKRVGNIQANMVSSGVSNLGIISLLIKKNILSRGSYLIVDEPEANLHPEWQHLMLEVLADLSEKDIHVVIATHSLDLIFKLQSIIDDKENSKEHFSINRLNISGKSEKREGLSKDILKAKKDLNKPYTNLYEERLPQ